MPFDPNKLKSFLAKGGKTGDGGGPQARTGGKGSVRRKKKVVRKQTTHDDKRLKSQLSKLNVRDIPAIEEVNLFKDDGTVIHFASPKVQASIASNTYVVTGNAETKKLQELLPGIINQLGPDNLEDLKKIYASFTPPTTGNKAAEEDDEDIPALVSNFEDQSNQPKQDKKNETEDKDKKADKKAVAPQKDTKETTVESTPKEKEKEKPKEPEKEKPKEQAKEKSKPAPKEKEKEKEEEGDEEEDEEEEADEEGDKEDVPDLVDS